MKKELLIIVLSLFTFQSTKAQQFIDKAVIEYEVKANLKKTGTSGLFEDLVKDQMPEYKTGYYTLSFSGNKSLYKFDRWGAGMTTFAKNRYNSDENNVWYYNFSTGNCNIDKSFWGSIVSVADSIPQLDWKLDPTEYREIAGFNCRKAQAILFDSVYVFAYYTEEITLPGGPAGFHGLPGTILGITVPRLYTSWIATNVSITGLKENTIKAPSQKKPLTYSAFKTSLKDLLKTNYTETDPELAREQKEYADRMYWESLM
ncbi:MAG TPA: GLPGLI family protein [Ginsengibacter sp.]|nr:GLPGLI family protein [Chitinophagaceae bacterium]MCO5287036.1 GLPGLI family protein [Chitinophagaceae bacterium]MCW5913941.1 GLPGLI family protein [Chitinophagaceae bacterium]MCZ2397948.1 GLPGLI family protein [Chitinophagales bacterium]HRP45613.1 GLPGLI family protein [Ginsengibacter sp.]